MSTELASLDDLGTPPLDLPPDLPSPADNIPMATPLSSPMSPPAQAESGNGHSASFSQTDFPSPDQTAILASLSRGQKAAIIVRVLLADGADLPISDFPEDLQHSLTRSMGSLKSITQETMVAVVEEFISEIDNVGMFFPGGLDGALKILENSLSPSMVTRLRREAGGVFYGDPWEKIVDLPTEILLDAMRNESIEVCAVMLSKLDVSRAAELLGLIPGARARRIAYAVSLTKSVTPEAVRRIGISLAQQLNNQPPVAFDDDPVDRVGAILNFSQARRRDEVLDGLEQDDSEFAARVRKAIFTFANIPQRIYEGDMPKIIRGLDQADLVTALGYARQTGEEAAVDYIMQNMSKRLAASLEEEIGERGEVGEADGEAAQAKVVAMVRRLEATGEISLRMDDA
ncbi:flagellar motor switch protein FliG [Halocynthiibacter sp. C4]|uniref:flagellar motor switch protein FliG n=1 Tax=Halocynthiibacter sp. C4 TaxID=2992758 RepID=UPI00237B06E0|nr:FliG C-terminal domain-containing protein [Halocynthiibacter sp. C4]MDE0589918.1 flagellar motor switch protein FliG [Halocynthiibacter sp. C4]